MTNFLDDYLSYLSEGYILDDKSYSVDLDKFENGESNILLIDGMGGTGKTTLGKKLAKKYNCKLYQSDDCIIQWRDNNKKTNPEKCFINNYRKIKRSNQRYIIEGVLVHTSSLDGWNPKLSKFFDEIKFDPIIILGTSVLKTMFRYYKESKDETMWIFIKNFINFGRYYDDEMKPYKHFVKKRLEVPNSNIKIFKF